MRTSFPSHHALKKSSLTKERVSSDNKRTCSIRLSIETDLRAMGQRELSLRNQILT